MPKILTHATVQTVRVLVVNRSETDSLIFRAPRKLRARTQSPNQQSTSKHVGRIFYDQNTTPLLLLPLLVAFVLLVAIAEVEFLVTI